MKEIIKLPFDTVVPAHLSTYKVIQELGRGGNSNVYLVICDQGEYKGVLFAMKIFLQIEKEDRKIKFNREVGFLKKFDHPAIMRIFDDGIYRDHNREFPFSIAEFLPRTLETQIGKDLPIARKVNYVHNILSGLVLLDKHDPPIIHRDIKPENIFIRGNSCVIGDFGLMKLVGENEEDRDTFSKTDGPAMPKTHRTPDLVNYSFSGGDLSTKSDIFQLGLVASELFTGFNPLLLSKEKKDEIVLDLAKIMKLQGSNPIGKNVSELILQMLDFEPDTRISAEKLRDEWKNLFRRVMILCFDLDGKVLL